MKGIILSIGMFLFCCLANANAQDSLKKRIKISDVTLFAGFMTYRESAAASIEDFKNLAPQSELLKNDFSGFRNYSSGYSRFNSYYSSSLISGSIGINFLNKEKSEYRPNPQLRIGLSYLNSFSLTNTANKTEFTPYDTLSSSQTNQTFPVDSVKSTEYHMYYNADQVRLSFSLIYRNNPSCLASIYGGGGVNIGFSLYESTHIYYRETNSITFNSYYNTGSYPNDSSKMETFYNKTTFGFSAFLPLGIDFALGTRKNFWKRLHVFAEVRPEISFINVPELKKTYSHFSFERGLGLRYSWL